MGSARGGGTQSGPQNFFSGVQSNIVPTVAGTGTIENRASSNAPLRNAVLFFDISRRGRRSIARPPWARCGKHCAVRPSSTRVPSKDVRLVDVDVQDNALVHGHT